MGKQRAEIKQIVQDVKSLPAIPGIVARLSDIADNEKATINEIANLINSDQILSAKVLKLVNSPFYGFPRRVSTISNALILLGVNVVKSLVLSSSIFEMMEKNVVGLWEHSFGSAIAANVIARQLRLPEPEEITTAALLHDIGKVVIKTELKDEYIRLLGLIKCEDMTSLEAEQKLFSTDHAEIGGWLVKTWHLPDKLMEPIAFHHNVEGSKTQNLKTASVHLADVIVKASGFGLSGDECVPKISPAASKALGLNVEILESIVDEVENKLVEAENFSMEIQSKNEPQS